MSLKHNPDEPGPNVSIKEEADWRMEDCRAPGKGFQEFADEMESSTSLRGVYPERRKIMRKREKNRELRAKGAEYVTAKGEKKGATQKPTSEVKCKCNFKCSTLSLEHRTFLFNQYRSLDRNSQRAFLANLVDVVPVSRQTTLQPSRRKISTLYRLRDEEGQSVPVCKSTFQDTFGLSRGETNVLRDKTKYGFDCMKDRRGGAFNKKYSNADRDLVVEFIDEIARDASHYGHKDTNKEYLSSDLNYHSLHREFSRVYPNSPVKVDFFARIFKEHFSNPCKTSDQLAIPMKAETKEELIARKNLEAHHMESDLARSKMKIDCLSSDQNRTCLRMGLQQHSPNHGELCVERNFPLNFQTGTKNAKKTRAGGQPREPRIVWSEEAENTLISLWKEQKNVRRDIHFCERLAAELEIRGHQWSALQVKRKIHNWQGKYREEKRKMGLSTWIHYDKVNAIMGEDDNLMEESGDEMLCNASELIPVTAIKKEPTESRLPSTEFHELAVKVEPLQSSQSELELSHTAPVADAAHCGPLTPQTLDYLKVELILDDELPVSASSSHAQNLDIPEPAAYPQGGVSTAEDSSMTCERSPKSYQEVFIKTQPSHEHCAETHKCEYCLRLFLSAEYLRKHIAAHYTLDNGEFTCELCGRSFSCKGNVVQHMKKHAGDTYNCEVCGKKYTQNHNLKTHMLQKHPEHKNLFIPSLQTSRDTSGHSGSQTSYDASVNSEDNIQYISGVDSNFDASVPCENTRQSTFAPIDSNDAPVQSGDNLHSTSGPVTLKDASVHPKDNFQHNVLPQISPDASRHSEHKPLYTSDLPTSFVGSVHSEDRHQSHYCAVTINEPAIHTKTELMSDEEFLDEDNGADSAQGNQQSVIVSTAAESGSFEVAHNLNPKEGFSANMGVPHCNKTFKCELCPRSFKQAKHLNQHMTAHANRPRVYACETCGKTFSASMALNNHRRLHTGRKYKVVYCQLCGAAFKDNTQRKMHMLRLHGAEVQKIVPKPQTANADSVQIKTELTSDEEFIEEGEGTRSDHESQLNLPEDSVSCELCHNIYPKELLSTHMRLAHRTWKCEFCSKSFKTKGNLKQHMSAHAKDRDREFDCKTCGLTFPAAASLRAHNRFHTGRKDKVANCQACGLAFKGNTQLKMHMLRRHLGEVQLTVPKPQTKTELTSDESLLEEDNGATSAQGNQQTTSICFAEDSVSCEVSHNVNPKEVLNTDLDVPHYNCELCPRSFKHVKYLNQHMSAHANRPHEYVCETCGKTFSAALSLNNHRRVHTGRRYYVVYCQVCGAAFKDNTQRKEHMLRRHLAELLQSVPKPQTANADSVQTKTELASDQEFVEEDEGTRSAHENQQTTSISLAEDIVSCEFCHNIYPKELFSTHMRLAHRSYWATGRFNFLNK